MLSTGSCELSSMGRFNQCWKARTIPSSPFRYQHLVLSFLSLFIMSALLTWYFGRGTYNSILPTNKYLCFKALSMVSMAVNKTEALVSRDILSNFPLEFNLEPAYFTQLSGPFHIVLALRTYLDKTSFPILGALHYFKHSFLFLLP